MKLADFLQMPCGDEKGTSYGSVDSFPFSILLYNKIPICLVDRRSPRPALFFIEHILQDPIYSPNLIQRLWYFVIRNRVKLRLFFLKKTKLRLTASSFYNRIKEKLFVHKIINPADDLYILFCPSLRMDTRYTVFAFSKEKKEPSAVIKIGTCVHSTKGIRQEYRILSSISRIPPGERNFGIPELHFLDRVNPKIMFIGQSFVSGRRMTSLLTKNNIFAYIENVKEHIINIENIFLEKSSTVRSPYDYFSDTIHIAEELTDEKMYFINKYKTIFLNGKIILPRTIMHGDVTPRNIFVSGEKLTFIDWEYGMLNGIPSFDMFHFVLTSTMYISRESFFKSFKKVFVNEGPMRDFAENLFEDYFKRIGVDSAYVDCFLFFYLARWYSITSIFKEEIKFAINLLIKKGYKLCF